MAAGLGISVMQPSKFSICGPAHCTSCVTRCCTESRCSVNQTMPLQVVRLRISLIHADLFAFRVAMSPATSQPPQKTSSQPQQEAAATSQSPQETAASATTTTTKPAEKEPASKVPRVVMVSVAAAGCLLRDWQVQLQSGLSMLGPNGQPARSWDPWVADCSHTHLGC